MLSNIGCISALQRFSVTEFEQTTIFSPYAIANIDVKLCGGTGTSNR